MWYRLNLFYDKFEGYPETESLIGKFTEALLLYVQRSRMETEFLGNVMKAEAAIVDVEHMKEPYDRFNKARKFYMLSSLPYMQEEEEAKAEYLRKALKEATSDGPLVVRPLEQPKYRRIQHDSGTLPEVRKQ